MATQNAPLALPLNPGLHATTTGAWRVLDAIDRGTTRLPELGPWLLGQLLALGPPLHRVVVQTNLWLSLSLASLALFAAHAAGVVGGLGPATLVFVSSMLIYNLDHLTDARQRVGRGFLARRAGLLLVLAAAVATGLMLWAAPPAARWVFAAYASVGLLYGVRFVPVWSPSMGFDVVRLKEVAGAKSWIVAAAIALATVGLPLAWAGLSPTLDSLLVGAYFFVFVATGAHTCDVRDIEADRRAGVSTLPRRLGIEGSRRVLLVMNGVTVVALGALWSTGLAAPHPEIIWSVVASVGYVLWLGPRSSPRGFDVVLDGAFLVPALAMLVHA